MEITPVFSVAGQEVLRHLAGYLEFFFCRVSDSLFIHVTITRGTHNTVLWVPVWETIGYRVKYGVIVVCL